MTTPSSLLSSIPQTTLEEQSLERLREAIIGGAFQPGSQINPALLAANLGVSRGTIRSALSKLEEEGLVVNLTHKGSFISRLDQQTVRDIYGVREALETYAVHEAVPRCNAQDIEEMRSIFETMQRSSKIGDVSDMIRNDLNLHAFFIRHSGNEVLQQIWYSLEVRIRWLLSYRYFSFPYLQDMADSHILLVRYTEENKPDQAADIIRRHICEARDDILNRWSELK